MKERKKTDILQSSVNMKGLSFLGVFYLYFTQISGYAWDPKDPALEEFSQMLMHTYIEQDNILIRSIGGTPIDHSEDYSNLERIKNRIRDGSSVKSVFDDMRRDGINLERLIALFTPLLGVSEQCLNASQNYVGTLLNPLSPDFIKALHMLDSSSKLPNGILRDSFEYCYFHKTILGYSSCPINPGVLYIPYGNTKAIGHYGECREERGFIPTRFCRLGLRKPPGSKSIPPTVGGVLSAMNLEWSVCVPKDCEPEDVRTNYEKLLQLYPEARVEILNCDEVIETSSLVTPLGIFFCGILIVGLLGTFSDVVELGQSKFSRILRCFSAYSNIADLLKTEPEPNTVEEYLCLCGLTTISFLWVIFSSTMKTFMSGNVINQMAPLEVSLQIGYCYWESMGLNDTFAYETLFFVFGVRLSFWVISQLNKSDGAFNPIKYYIEGYIRFLLPTLLAYVIFLSVVPAMTEGPLYKTVEDHGLADLMLFLTNFRFAFNITGVVKNCLNHAWFISCLVQLSIFAPIIIYQLWRRKFQGIVCWIGVFSVSLISYEVLIYVFDLPPSDLYMHYVLKHEDYTISPSDFFHLPISRAQPFLLGIICGYFTFYLKKNPIQIPKFFNIGIWFFALFLLAFPPLSLQWIYSDDTFYGPRKWNYVHSLGYTLFSKVAWNAGICWVFTSCILGYGGYINSFLSWGPFITFSRTFVSGYLIHEVVVQAVVNSILSSYDFAGIVLLQYFLGIATITQFVSIFLTAYIEVPMFKLRKVLFLEEQEEKNPFLNE